MLVIKRCMCMVLVLLALNACSQQSTRPVTLKQLLNNVTSRAPQLLTDSAAISIRQAQAAEVKNNWLPNLKLNYQTNVGTSNNVIGAYFGFGIVPSSSSGVHTNNITTAASTNLGIAELDWEVYNFGAYGAANKVANSDINVEQNNFAQSKYQLQAVTISNYLQLLRLNDFLTIQARDIQRNLEIRRSIESLAKSGVRAGVDTSIAEAALSKSRLNFIELENQFKQIQLRLSTLSGIPYPSIIPDTSTDSALISQPTALMSSLDTSTHPVINFYRSVYQNSLQREGLVKKQYNPKISLEAAAWDRGSSIDAAGNYGSLGSGFGFERDNYLVGIGISYNLFDLRRRHLKLNSQKASTNYALKKLEEQQQLLAASSNEADVEMTTALQRLQEIPNQLKAANDGYRQKLSLYRSGLTDIIELNAALNILYTAETDYAQAKYSYANALIEKAFTGNQLNQILNILK